MARMLAFATLAGLCGAIALLPSPAAARPVQTTKYAYYKINGNTAPEIYAAMIKRGPEVDGVNAYASTNAVSSQAGQLAQGKTCTVHEYALKMDFTINLPKLKNEQALTGAVKTNWVKFSSFLKTHEETHRSIWLACGAKLEKKIRGLQAKTCQALDKKTAVLWNQMRKDCGRQHAAFDAAQQKSLLAHPFVKLVLRQSLNKTSALSPPKKKRR